MSNWSSGMIPASGGRECRRSRVRFSGWTVLFLGTQKTMVMVPFCRRSFLVAGDTTTTISAYYRIVRLTLLLSLPIHIDSPHRPSSFRGQVFLKVDHASSAARHLIPECDGQHSVEYGERLAEGISKLLVFDVCK